MVASGSAWERPPARRQTSLRLGLRDACKWQLEKVVAGAHFLSVRREADLHNAIQEMRREVELQKKREGQSSRTRTLHRGSQISSLRVQWLVRKVRSEELGRTMWEPEEGAKVSSGPKKIPSRFVEVDALQMAQKKKSLEGAWPAGVDLAVFLSKRSDTISRLDYPFFEHLCFQLHKSVESQVPWRSGWPGKRLAKRQPLQLETYHALFYRELVCFILGKVEEGRAAGGRWAPGSLRLLDEYMRCDNRVDQMLAPPARRTVTFDGLFSRITIQQIPSSPEHFGRTPEPRLRNYRLGDGEHPRLLLPKQRAPLGCKTPGRQGRESVFVAKALEERQPKKSRSFLATVSSLRSPTPRRTQVKPLEDGAAWLAVPPRRWGAAGEKRNYKLP